MNTLRPAISPVQNVQVTGRRKELFAAKDVYEDWKRLVSGASTSVVMFSPYLDRLVPQLLRHTSLPSSAITVVTDLSPQEASGYLGQLRALLRLLELGVQVRTLPRLHAKVLLVDDKFVTSGSQNFTSYARRSKEVTALPDGSLEKSRFLDRLRDWLRASEPVDAEIIERLLKGVRQAAKAASEAESALQLTIAQTVSEVLLERQRRAEAERARAEQLAADRFSRDRLFGLKSAKSTRLARGEALIRRATGGDSLNPYTTFMADANTDLTSWLVADGDDRTRRVNLDPFDWYPVLMTGSGRMAWARVVKTRITYVKTGVSFTQTRYLDETKVKVGVSFPKKTSSGANVVITLKETPFAFVGCRIHALFDGESIALVSVEQTGQLKGPGYGDQFQAACQDLFASPDELTDFVKFVFGDIRFSETGIGNHNADDFFQGQSFRLRLLEFLGTPVLVAHRLR